MAEAKYIAASVSATKAIWLHNLLSELHMDTAGPTSLDINNQLAIMLTKDGILHCSIKHITIHYHYIHFLAENQEATPIYVPTDLQVADILTKSLGHLKHGYFTSVIRIIV